MSQPVGKCPCCQRCGITIVKTTGRLWRHGPRNNPCIGSDKFPSQLNVLGQSNPAEFENSSVDLFASLSQSLESAAVSHPPVGQAILKRVSKGARSSAASLLTRLIRGALNNFDVT